MAIFLFLLYACNKPNPTGQEPAGMDMMTDMIHLTAHEEDLIHLAIDTAQIKIIVESSEFTGTATVDESNTSSISSRVNGRIEKLFVRNAGDVIRKGQALYSVYSEELLSDENEFLLSLEQQSTFTGQINNVNAFVEASHKKLLFWGLSEAQIKELTQNKITSPTINVYSEVNGYLSEINISEGEYVSIGTALFKIASLETVWVNAEIYQNEISYFLQSPEIELEFEVIPDEIFKGKVIQNPPILEADKNVSFLKIVLQNQEGKIKPGMMATVSAKRNEKKTLVISKSALVLSKEISVWIQTKPGMYESRMVKTGIENKTEVEILSGLVEGELVVSSGAYLLNSAFVLKNGANAMGGMKM